MTRPTFTDPLTRTIVSFLQAIGLDVRAGQIPAETFLPGIWIDHGALLIDEARLRYPGDLLHEAGHLAVAAPARRTTISGDVGPDAAEEMMAIAWSYAAALHLRIDPAVVFHEAGYQGGARSIVENFQQGHTFGVPMLQWAGMTYDATQAASRGVAPYPHMICWLRPDGEHRE
ncbi:MAG TPA: hypothetical protein VFZ66_23470 [Herpetosiphonaceae bacterium]